MPIRPFGGNNQDRAKAGSLLTINLAIQWVLMKHEMTGAYSTHKLTGNSWRAMKNRCDNSTYRAYQHYGGRGITYDKRWKYFSNFLSDMGERPGKEYSLDRIDNNGPYCKENCRWVTQEEQVNNSARVLNAKVTKVMLKNAQASPAVVYKRVRNGWNIDDALNTLPTSTYIVQHKRAMLRRADCPICGKKANTAKNRYCSRECYQESRRRDYEQKKKKLQKEQTAI